MRIVGVRTARSAGALRRVIDNAGQAVPPTEEECQMETPTPSPPTVPDSQPVPDVPEPSPPPVPEPGAPEVPEPEVPDEPDVPAPELPIDDPGAPEIPDSPGLRG